MAILACFWAGLSALLQALPSVPRRLVFALLDHEARLAWRCLHERNPFQRALNRAIDRFSKGLKTDTPCPEV